MTTSPTKKTPRPKKTALSELLQGTLEVFPSLDFNGPPMASFDAELIVSRGNGPMRPATGFLYSGGRQVGTMQASFPAELFEPSKPAGAPKKTARDVAILCALALCKARQTQIGEAGIIAARNEVVSMWQTRGFKGLTNEKHVRDRLPAALEATKSTAAQFVYLTERGFALVILFDNGSEWTFYDDCAFVNGSGWSWFEGKEKAQHGKFKVMRFSWPLSEENAKLAAGFKAALAGDSIAEFVIHDEAGPGA